MAATLRRVGAGPEMRHRGEQAAAAIGGAARFVRADMADTESVKSLVQQCGDVDIIVNSAASFPAALTVEQDPATFETTFNTNVCGAYFLVAGLVPAMLERGRGSIVNITTMAAFKGIPGASGYSASKAALESLTRTWAAEFGSGGVRVNSVAPGPHAPTGVAAEWGRDQRGTRPGICRWAAPRTRRRSPRRCCSSPHPAPASSPARP